MLVRRFTVRSMPEAMDLIRRELGPEAVILSSRRTSAPGFVNRLRRRKVYEVTAAAGSARSPGTMVSSKEVPAGLRPSPDGRENAYRSEADRRLELVEEELRELRSVVAAVMGHSRAAGHPAGQEWTALADMIKGSPPGLERVAAPVVLKKKVDPAVEDLARRLEATGLAPDLAHEFKASLGSRAPGESGQSLRSILRGFVGEKLDSIGAPRLITPDDRIVTFLGPTGVGKTTTVAKLAAQARIREGRRVGLLTLDTYRVGAIEQLRTYADILGIPLAVAETAGEVRASVGQLSDCELILVDTAGRSYLEDAHIADLSALFGELPPHLTYLVVDLKERVAEAVRIARRLEVLRFDAMVLTKADEAIWPSLALTMAARFKKPLSYLGTGQRVPDDIEFATSSALLARFEAEGSVPSHD